VNAERPPLRARLGVRFFVGAVLVLGIGALTAWVVALLTGPAIFHEHMLMVQTSEPDPEVVAHAEEAFDHTWQLSLALALLTACLASIMVSLFLARRVVVTLNKIRRAATRVAGGDYGARIPEGGMGAELAEMADAFNGMAVKLAETEQTRKRLLSDLAHEMRTPLATIDGYLEGMLDGVAEADASTLAMLRGQTDRLRRLADDISLVSLAEEHQLKMEPEHVFIGDLLRAAEAQARTLYATKGVNLLVEHPSENAVLIGDRERVLQVLTNLLDNALRHTEEGDRATLRADVTDEAVVVCVEDTGHGIAEQHLPHLFERFYRIDGARDRAHGGSGIGLAIVRSITEAHGGRVTAQSRGVGHGATFKIELPRTMDECSDPHPPL
jgi:two-component system, OmpR family, sensor histidine kinase BaeS